MLLRVTMCLLGLSALLAGCIAVPVAVPEEKPFEEAAEASFQIGASTRADVKEVFGEPELRNANWWLFHDTRNGWQWSGCAAMPGACGTTDRGRTEYFLRVAFDAGGTLSHYEIFQEDRLCKEHKVCFKNGLLMRAALTGDGDPEAIAPADHCMVTVYSDTDRDSMAGVVEVNGRRVGTLVGTRGFLSHPVSAGRHLWIVFPSGKMMQGVTASLELQCDGKQSHYLRYSSGILSPMLEKADEATGNTEIAARWPALPDIDPDVPIETNWLDQDRVFVVREDDTLKVFELTRPGKVRRFGVSMSGEPCGLRAAIEDYGLTPVGMMQRLEFTDSRTLNSSIDVVAVCNGNNACEFASVFDGLRCMANPVEYVELRTLPKLLVLEPAGDNYTELYFGKARPLMKQADCSGTNCRISVARLREIQKYRLGAE